MCALELAEKSSNTWNNDAKSCCTKYCTMENCIEKAFKENNINKFPFGFAPAPFPISKQLYLSFLSLSLLPLPEIINGRHKQRSGRHTLARQKNIQKKSLLPRPLQVEALAMLLDGRVGLVRLSWRSHGSVHGVLIILFPGRTHDGTKWM